MSTIDTSTWNPDADLNVEIEGIPLNSNAGIAQTWQVIRILMAAFKGDTSAIQALMVPFSGATASADGVSGFVPAPEAGDQDKFLKGDGTWGNAPTPNLGTASHVVQTDANGVLAVSSVTATELGYLSGVTSAVQTQISDKISKSGGAMTGEIVSSSGLVARRNDAAHILALYGGTESYNGGKLELYGGARSTNPGSFALTANIDSSTVTQLLGKPDGTLKWGGQPIQTSSDERLKTPLSSVPDEVLDAWEGVQWGRFQYLDAVERKGASARLHLGLIAQRVKAVFEARGLDACAYGILCYDKDEDLWMVRYEEALAMEATCQRRRADRLEARIKALEEAMR